MWLTIGNDYSGSAALKGLTCDVAYVGGYYFSSGNIYDNYIKTMTYTKKINEFGQLYKKDYLKGISNVYNINYEYNKLEVTDAENQTPSIQVTNLVSKETHKYGTNEDKLVYTYDQLGRIATINSYENNIHSYYKQYTYTEDSSLLNDVDLRYNTAIIYEYDNTGNVILNGKVIGKHTGLYKYTIGQRKGLGISHENPLYVIGFNKNKNELIVGEENDLYVDNFEVINYNLLAIDEINKPIDVNVKTRYKSLEYEATIEMKNNNILVKLDKPIKGVTSGQSAVFYIDDVVLGGGIIK